MKQFKRYLTNLIGTDLIIVAIYMVICTVVGLAGKVEVSVMGAILAGLSGLFMVLISTILITIGLFLIHET